jgi:hypothetical protein
MACKIDVVTDTVQITMNKDEFINMSDYFYDKDNDIEGYNIDDTVNEILKVTDRLTGKYGLEE